MTDHGIQKLLPGVYQFEVNLWSNLIFYLLNMWWEKSMFHLNKSKEYHSPWFWMLTLNVIFIVSNHTIMSLLISILSIYYDLGVISNLHNLDFATKCITSQICVPVQNCILYWLCTIICISFNSTYFCWVFLSLLLAYLD